MSAKTKGSVPPPDKLQVVQAQVEEIKLVMHDNINKAIERGDKIDVLLDKSDQLEKDSNRFWKGARSVRRKFQCQNARQVACVSSAVVIIIVVVALIIWSQTKN